MIKFSKRSISNPYIYESLSAINGYIRYINCYKYFFKIH